VAAVVATAAVVEDMVVAAVGMPVVAVGMPVVADMPAVAAATRALPAAVALRGTSVPDRQHPARLRRQVRAAQVRAVIDLRPATLPRTMPSAEQRRSMRPGTQRAMQTGP
jgi:hypothetical protein